MIRRRVLLVEDDADDLSLALLAFRDGNFPYPVDVARDGAQALAHLRGAKALPALVVLDLKLPKIGGLEVLQRVRADPRLKSLLAVVLSGSDEPRDKKEAERLGAARYFVKPVGLAEYITIVKVLESLVPA